MPLLGKQALFNSTDTHKLNLGSKWATAFFAEWTLRCLSTMEVQPALGQDGGMFHSSEQRSPPKMASQQGLL